MTDLYSEYIDRQSWQPGLILQSWISRQTALSVLRNTTLKANVLRIAEFGPGIGMFAGAIEDLGVEKYVGFEPNPQIASITQSRLARGRVVIASLPKIPSEFEDSFDIAIAIQVLEHSAGPTDARQWLEAMAKVVQVDGLVIIISPNLHDYGAYFWEIDWTHTFPTTSERIMQIGRDIGLDVVSATTIRGGQTGITAKFFLRILSFLIPTRLINYLSSRILNRPLGTGLQSALLWSSTFVIFRRTR